MEIISTNEPMNSFVCGGELLKISVLAANLVRGAS